VCELFYFQLPQACWGERRSGYGEKADKPKGEKEQVSPHFVPFARPHNRESRKELIEHDLLVYRYFL